MGRGIKGLRDSGIQGLRRRDEKGVKGLRRRQINQRQGR